MISLQNALEAHLRGHVGDPVSITGLRALGGGACQDNYALRVETPGGAQRLVLRSDARGSLPGSLGRQEEFAVIVAAHAAGVPTPAARYLGQGLVREDAWAYFLDFADGEALGAKVVRAPELAAARERLPEELAAALASIHRITPATHPDLPLRTFSPDEDPATAALAFQRRVLEHLPEPHPPLALAMRWLEDNKPATPEVTLVHGDFRVGNFLVTPAGLSAVLDWEFAHWGAPLEDVAWLCVRDWRFGRDGLAAGGICGRRRFYGAYAAASGRDVDPAVVHFWEVLGNVRWAAGAVIQGLRYLRGGEADLELLAIARRAAEMEFEALRLIEVGPPGV